MTAAGLTAGDEVAVQLPLDTEAREAEVPVDPAAALDAEPAVRAQGVELLRGGRKHR